MSVDLAKKAAFMRSESGGYLIVRTLDFPQLARGDPRIELRVVRLAADGVWRERIMNTKSKNLKGVEECLVEMTRIR